jgi:hypothetical protein
MKYYNNYFLNIKSNQILVLKLGDISFIYHYVSHRKFVSFTNHVLEFLFKRMVMEILLNKEIQVFDCKNEFTFLKGK